MAETISVPVFEAKNRLAEVARGTEVVITNRDLPLATLDEGLRTAAVQAGVGVVPASIG